MINNSLFDLLDLPSLLCMLPHDTLSNIIILSLSLCYYNVSHIITVFFSEMIGSNSADVNLTCKKTESFSQITKVILQLQPSEDESLLQYH